jgi:uncharacterized Zn finger protein (UPF0148 family)
MSDFDREAEREKLREKYERDEQKREHSERMSELLLKGATMTNVHCDDCGDPIFRYDGQEFCPTCQREVGTGAPPEAADAPGQDPDIPDESGSDPTVDAADRAPDAGSDVVADGVVADAGAEPASTPEPSATAGDERPDPDGTAEGAAGGSGRADAGRDAAAGQSARSGSPAEQRPGSRPGDGDLAEARAALVRTLADAARRAEATTDPRTRRDPLAAAREAAEALSALR